MATFPARRHSASRPRSAAHSLSSASHEVSSPTAPSARRVHFSVRTVRAPPIRPRLCLGRDLSAFRVSHPLDGFLLVEPRRSISPGKRSWGSLPLAPAPLSDSECFHSKPKGRSFRTSRKRAAARRRRDEHVAARGVSTQTRNVAVGAGRFDATRKEDGE